MENDKELEKKLNTELKNILGEAILDTENLLEDLLALEKQTNIILISKMSGFKDKNNSYKINKNTINTHNSIWNERNTLKNFRNALKNIKQDLI